mmetsp:Transcript_15193/g.23457  ORF Transcript_15193/g.23457 Transcript_15193/m.23457 type:complete len:300 (-) Transcript_15193:522-1421(-)
MLSVYLFPIILRPMDFLLNFKSYVMGMLIYIVMLPTFANLMAIYSMANLHDLSWGNRPSAAQASAGTNALSQNVNKQQELKTKYMMFRTQFMMFWVVCNGLYVIIIEALVNQPTTQVLNDGSYGFLEGFAVFIASLVVFRFGFGLLHILSTKFRTNCRKDRKYNVDEVNLKRENRRLRKQNDESDYDEEIRELLEQDKQDAEDDELLESYTKTDWKLNQAAKRKANLQVKQKKEEKNKLKVSLMDKDDDDEEFDDADKEEAYDENNMQISGFMISTNLKFPKHSLDRRQGGVETDDNSQ